MSLALDKAHAEVQKTERDLSAEKAVSRKRHAQLVGIPIECTSSNVLYFNDKPQK
jgi:hypothetical protein